MIQPIQEPRIVLQDIRTKKYFGGGKADKMFSHWVPNINEAKFFKTPEALNTILIQLKQRNEDCGVENILANPIIGTSIPPYTDEAYVALNVMVTKKETSSASAVNNG